MPLYNEKVPIAIVGIGFPMFVANMYAHRLIDDDTSRIMKLSTIGAELNTLQHFGHNSRVISIRGRINLAIGDGTSSSKNFLINGTGGDIAKIESLLTGIKLLKETKSAILVLMNHSVCYGVIEKFKIIDDREYPTSFDYEIEIIEKDLFGLKFSAITQRIFTGLIGRTVASADRKELVSSETVIPRFTERDEGV